MPAIIERLDNAIAQAGESGAKIVAFTPRLSDADEFYLATKPDKPRDVPERLKPPVLHGTSDMRSELILGSEDRIPI